MLAAQVTRGVPIVLVVEVVRAVLALVEQTLPQEMVAQDICCRQI
jgi:hypothetical protein